MWLIAPTRALNSEENLMTKTYKPGEKALRSGQYEIIGPRGGKTGIERTVTKGEPLPPPLKPGQIYTLADPTKHARKRRKQT